jgi:hypothetical protein
LSVIGSPFFGVIVTSLFETLVSLPVTVLSSEWLAIPPDAEEAPPAEAPAEPAWSVLSEPIVSDEPPEPIAPPCASPVEEPVDEPGDAEPIGESDEPDDEEPVPLSEVEPAVVTTTPPELESLACATDELPLGAAWDCEWEHAIPSANGSANSRFLMDMEVLLGRRTCALHGRAAMPLNGYTPPWMTRLAALLLVLLAAGGCRRPAGPAETYRAFADAARSGDADGVWKRLSERSREVLDARARAAAARAPAGIVPASGRDLVVGALGAQAPRVEKVVVLRESADAAVVAVTVAGAPAAREVSLAREAGVWRVVLPFDN